MADLDVQQLWLAQVELPGFHPEAPGTDTVYGFVVRDGRDCILIDTGIGTGNDLIDQLYKPERADLQAALLDVNVSPGDVT